jgi:hypothetical protein
MHKRSGSAVNPGNLHSFCKSNATVKHGGCEENFFSLQSDCDNEGTTSVWYITNIPTYIYICKCILCKSTNVKVVMIQSESNDFR